jgi:hypothetical protein
VKDSFVQVFIDRFNAWRYRNAPAGSKEWLIGTEARYGGYITDVARGKVSTHDPRSREDIESGGMTGGDRMRYHGYAQKYSEYLSPFVSGKTPNTVVEVGILNGTGLALWCDLFPKARVIGLDIDLNNFEMNRLFLEKRGAFSKCQPELYEFDQFVDNTELLSSIFSSQKIDIFIDDGFHSDESIINTFHSVHPYLSSRFVYFVEDNDTFRSSFIDQYRNADYRIDSYDRLSVIRY